MYAFLPEATKWAPDAKRPLQSATYWDLHQWLGSVRHKKTCHFVWTITSVSADEFFLQFLYQLKQEWILYRGITEFTTLP